LSLQHEPGLGEGVR